MAKPAPCALQKSTAVVGEANGALRAAAKSQWAKGTGGAGQDMVGVRSC